MAKIRETVIAPSQYVLAGVVVASMSNEVGGQVISVSMGFSVSRSRLKKRPVLPSGAAVAATQKMALLYT
jgi:hypothetical protein